MVGLGATLALWLTWRNYRLTRRGQVTDRFIKALERLGSNESYIRHGGVLALEQIIEDAPDQSVHATQVLGAFLRDRTDQRQWDPPPDRSAPTANLVRLADDLQAALTALTGPAVRHHARNQRIDLRDRDLAGARLDKADLSGAWLVGVDLYGALIVEADLSDTDLLGANLSLTNCSVANFSRANLIRVNLSGANLEGANLANADLRGANLSEANLKGANLSGANLAQADLTNTLLEGVDLASVTGLTPGQVVHWAKIAKSTILPPNITADPAVVARLAEISNKDAVD